MKTDSKNPAPWVRRALSDADEARAAHSHPRMQQLHHAMRLVAEVTKDHGWMLVNDPDRQLDDALRTLVHVTTVRRS